MPAAEFPPFAVTVPPVIVIFFPEPCSPPPMPAASYPPFAVTVPPEIVMFFVVSLLFQLAPIPAPCSPPFAVREPSPLISNVESLLLLFHVNPAQSPPDFNEFVPSNIIVKLTLD